MTPTVHVLAYGRALCGQLHGVPRGWGRGQLWTSAFDPRWRHEATCCDCMAMAGLLEAARERHEREG